MSTDIMIYVADLAANNNGIHHGTWIAATQDMICIQTAVDCMLRRSPIEDAEEYAIHDTQGFGQYEGLESAHNAACFINDYPEFGAELLNHLCDIDHARSHAENNYLGCFECLEDYAQQFTEDTSTISEHLAYYIDYDMMGRDFEMSGDIFTIEVSRNRVHIFSSS